jgi:hypothetical protein
MQTHKDSRLGRDRQAMREANELPQPSIVDIDPEDPSQLLDDAGQFSIVDVDLDAQPQAEADAELDAALAEAAGEEGAYESDESDNDAQELDTPSQTTADAYAEAADDTGELYGVHLPAPADKDLDVSADGESFRDSELGEHAFETLEKKMAESGAEPERPLDIEDDSDLERGHSSSDTKDRPVADKGSGGPGGL